MSAEMLPFPPLPPRPPSLTDAWRERQLTGEWPLGIHWRILQLGESFCSYDEFLARRALPPWRAKWQRTAGSGIISILDSQYYKPCRRRVRFKQPGFRWLDVGEISQPSDEYHVLHVPDQWLTPSPHNRVVNPNRFRRRFDVYEAHRRLLEVSGVEHKTLCTTPSVLASIDHPDFV